MIVQTLPVSDEFVHVGFTVSKKVDKSAVRRNRIRRRLRAASADVLPVCALPGKYVIIGRIETATITYTDIVNDLKWCLKRLDCIKDEPDIA